MRSLRHLWRFVRTGATFARTGALAQLLDAAQAPTALRHGLTILTWPIRGLGYKGEAHLPPLPRALNALGPTYIKFGQMLSTRADLVGPNLARELRILQDRLPPFSMAQAKAQIAAELGRPAEALFSTFSEAVAAASVAQVHRATLRESGEVVAVKVLRPEIEKAFARDISAFRFGARLLERLSRKSRRLRPVAVIDHFASVVAGELDLRLEGAAASEFSAKTAKDPLFYVPKIHWATSGRRVLTMEWIDGIQASDLEALDAAGVDRKALAARILQQFLEHALHLGVFHGDMHQGNLRIAPDGTVIALDFGIMGTLDAYTRRVYAEILYGFVQRDYRRVAEVHFEAGYVPADQDIEEFARALRAVGEPIFGMDATHISMSHLLTYLFEVTERFGMQTRTELILLQRTMMVVEGVTRLLDPQSNIWSTSAPVIEAYIRRTIGAKAALKDLTETLRVLSRFGPRLPDLAQRALIAQNAPPPETKSRPWLMIGLALSVGLALGILLD